MHEFEEELKRLGVELKGLFHRPGRFFKLLDGLVIAKCTLCWQLGEPEVAHWHELDAGFAGRQQLAKVPT